MHTPRTLPLDPPLGVEQTEGKRERNFLIIVALNINYLIDLYRKLFRMSIR